jgi:pyruvate/2-oxoglutarate dehydrogenase complex dihydrolipoamide acyltransferase (E2) component
VWLADWKQDYARGLEAAQDGKWADVERYMQSALAANAKPAKRLRVYGQRYEIYAPQHYAGLAAQRQGDCKAALRFWSQGGNEAFIQGFPELLAQEREARLKCGSQLASQDKPAPKPAPKAVADAPPVQTPPRTAPKPPATPPPRPIAQAPPPQPPRDSSRGASGISEQILRPLVDAYLAGRYADVLKLSSKVPPSPKLRWHMLTLRAAAAYNLSRLDGDSSATRIAREAANEARKDEPGLKPDARFYSPRFLSFYAGS